MYTFSEKPTIEKYGIPMFEIRNTDNELVAYSETIFNIPKRVTLKPSSETFIFKESVIWGGVIRGGVIRGGVIRGGEIWGGVIWGGEIWGGVIWGGEIRGGVIRGGVIWGGEIRGGVIRGGEIWGGVIWGGVIRGGEIWGGVIWGGEIRGGVIKSTLIQIQGTRHFCSLDWFNSKEKELHLNIGCQSHTLDFWLENFKEIGNKNDYTSDEIEEYYGYIQLFSKKYGKVINNLNQ